MIINLNNKSSIFSWLRSQNPDKPEWLDKIMSDLFDTAYFYLNAEASDGRLQTTSTRESMESHAETRGYKVKRKSPAGCAVKINFFENKLHQIPISDLLFEVAPKNLSRYLAYAPQAIDFTGDSVIVPIIEGVKTERAFVGDVETPTPWLAILLPAPDIVYHSIEVFVNDLLWDRKNDLINSHGTDRDFEVVPSVENYTAIRFGDGKTGAMPVGQITVNFYTTLGSTGNARKETTTISFVGESDEIQSVELQTDFKNGSDGETLETLRFLIPKYSQKRGALNLPEHYEVEALACSPSLRLVKGYAGIFGKGSMALFTIPAGGGNPNYLLLKIIEDRLKAMSPPSQRDIRLRKPPYVIQSISVRVRLRSTAHANIINHIKFALKLLVWENTYELLCLYKELPFSDVLKYINYYSGYRFDTTDTINLQVALNRRLSDFFSLAYKDACNVIFGGNLELSSITTACRTLPGVESATILSPTTVPILNYYDVFTPGDILVTT